MASFSQTEQISGLAGKIRASVDSEQFDLAGYTEARARDLMLASFTQPLAGPKEMIRFQFIVGGGKLVRSRYDDGMSRWLSSALNEIGFSEDSSASCVADCQGTYKLQHDTSQNLKYFYVFPRLQLHSSGVEERVADMKPGLDMKSVDNLVVAADVSTFQEMVQKKVTSWRQKKCLLKLLQEKSEEFQALEAKLIRGEPLAPMETAIYEANCGCDAEKITWLQTEIKATVDSGFLTAAEKTELLAAIEVNIRSTNAEIEAAKVEGKNKKVEKLNEKLISIQTKKSTIEKVSPITRRLVHAERIQKCWSKLLPLITLEEKGKSLSLTLADLKVLEEKPELEDQIEQLQNASRGWFEDDEEFSTLCISEEKDARRKYKEKVAQQSKSLNKSRAGAVVGKNSSAWSTVAKAPGGSKQSAASTASKPKLSGYAAAFGGGDSSDDES